MSELTPKTDIDGMRQWLKGNGFDYQGLYPLYHLPPTCPWQFEPNLGIDQIVDFIFHPLKASLPKTIEILKERCHNILALHYQEKWYLLYALKIILRNDEDKPDLWTVDWDHETGEITKKERFWDFVDRKLSKVDETRYDNT
jgi:hypothetical protein